MNSPNQESRQLILVVDDSDSIRALLKIYLRKLPYDVAFACDGLDALEEIEKRTPDLILLDLMMPRMDGLTFIDRLNEDPDTSLIPRIIISAQRDTTALMNSVSRGVTAYLTKPVSFEQLTPMIEEALEHGSFSRGIEQ